MVWLWSTVGALWHGCWRVEQGCLGAGDALRMVASDEEIFGIGVR